MKVLVVEDDDVKRYQIEAFIRSRLAHAVLESARSLQSALELVGTFNPDVVLLDMSMPAFDVSAAEDGFEHLPFAGREFLEHLDLQGVSPCVIVVTSFRSFGKGADAMTLPQLDAQLSTDYADVYRGSVSYSSIGDEWQSHLAQVLDSITSHNG